MVVYGGGTMERAGLIKRSVDNKGRVVLPIEGLKEVYMATMGDIIIVSPNPEAIREVGEILDYIGSLKKKKAIDEWFKLVEEAGLDKISPKLIDSLVSRGVLRELE